MSPTLPPIGNLPPGRPSLVLRPGEAEPHWPGTEKWGSAFLRPSWGAKLGKLANFCKFLAGSFSAVSKRNFARKYAFDSIFQALQDLHTFAPLQSQNFSKKSVWKISNFRENSATFCKCCKNLQTFAIFAKFISSLAFSRLGTRQVFRFSFSFRFLNFHIVSEKGY